MRGVANVLDPRLGPAHATGALIVTGPQPVALPSLAAKLRKGALVRDPAAANDRNAVTDFLDLDQQVTREEHGHSLGGEIPDIPVLLSSSFARQTAPDAASKELKRQFGDFRPGGEHVGQSSRRRFGCGSTRWFFVATVALYTQRATLTNALFAQKFSCKFDS